jgi:transposase
MMKALPEEAKSKVLELLRLQRSQQEISDRTGVCIGTIQDWAAGWRKDGTLAEYTQAGSAYVARAQQMSNGYYKIIRKRYNGMRWTDKVAGRKFGFSNPT